MQSSRSRKIVLYCVLCGLLMAYAYRHVSTGVCLWDGGYNYANFLYWSRSTIGDMWFFSTYLANLCGALLVRIPAFHGLFGLNCALAFMVGLFACVSFIFMVEHIKCNPIPAFLGELLALSLCWLPYTVLYTYLSFGITIALIILLYKGLTLDKGQLLFLAGIILGLGVYVRFPNLVFMAFILGVWYWGIINKHAFAKLLSNTGLCAAGFFTSLTVIFVILGLIYGWDAYVGGIADLFGMTETARDYTPMSMLSRLPLAMGEVSYWLKRVGLAVLLSLCICLPFKNRFFRIKLGLVAIVMALLCFWLYKNNYCSIFYKQLDAVSTPYVAFMGLLIIALLVASLLPGLASSTRLFSCLLLLLLLVGSLGSNNATLSAMNNSFLVIPGAMYLLSLMIRKLNSLHPVAIPATAICLLLTGILMFQGLLFGISYIYEDATGMTTSVEDLTETDIPNLAHIRTSSAKSRELNELYLFISASEYAGRSTIVFGNIPGVTAALELTPAMNTWSELRSYSMGRYISGLNSIMAEADASGEYPIIIIKSEYVACYDSETGDFDFSNAFFDDDSVKEKLTILIRLIRDNEFSEIFSNGYFTVYSH